MSNSNFDYANAILESPKALERLMKEIFGEGVSSTEDSSDHNSHVSDKPHAQKRRFAKETDSFHTRMMSSLRARTKNAVFEAAALLRHADTVVSYGDMLAAMEMAVLDQSLRFEDRPDLEQAVNLTALHMISKMLKAVYANKARK